MVAVALGPVMLGIPGLRLGADDRELDFVVVRNGGEPGPAVMA